MMTTIVIMNQKQIQGRDDTKHPQKNQRCCKYKETIVETKTYDGCSSIPHQATNTSTEQHVYKVLDKNLQLLEDDDDEEEGERTVKLSSFGLVYNKRKNDTTITLQSPCFLQSFLSRIFAQVSSSPPPSLFNATSTSSSPSPPYNAHESLSL